MLTEEKCVACRAGSTAVTEAEMPGLMEQVPGWDVIQSGGIGKLTREFQFANFADALAFTNRVGAVAEAENHHPAILTEWGRVTVSLWTHTIEGLHRNDFVVAAKINAGEAV